MAHYERADGWTAMRALLALDDPPDAVFCFNDLMAIGALRACADAGVSVPGQVAVAGFDDITEGRFANPRLTTVAADLDVLAREALRLLLRRVNGADATAERVAVPWRIEVRESTAAPTCQSLSGL